MDKIYKYIHIGFSKENYNTLCELAKQDYRTPAQYIRHITLVHLKNLKNAKISITARS